MAKKDFMNLMKEKTTDLKPSLLSSEENIKSQIRILEPLRDLIPPLISEELYQLEQNILKHGVKDPLTVWETTSTVAGIDDANTPVFILIDGHNRFAICQKYKLDYRINIVRFSSMEETKDYMIDFQLGRRNLSPEQSSYFRGLRYIRQRSLRGGNRYGDSEQIDVSMALAKEYGVSSRTIKRDGDFASGLEKLTPDFKKEILTGKLKLPKASINTLSKLETETLLSSMQEVLALITSPTVKSEESEDEETQLAGEIRSISRGSLTKESCTRLIALLQQYMQSLDAK